MNQENFQKLNVSRNQLAEHPINYGLGDSAKKGVKVSRNQLAEHPINYGLGDSAKD